MSIYYPDPQPQQRPARLPIAALTTGAQPPRGAVAGAIAAAILIGAQPASGLATQHQSNPKQVAPLTLKYGQQPPISAAVIPAEMAALRLAHEPPAPMPPVPLKRTASGAGAVVIFVPYTSAPLYADAWAASFPPLAILLDAAASVVPAVVQVPPPGGAPDLWTIPALEESRLRRRWQMAAVLAIPGTQVPALLAQPRAPELWTAPPPLIVVASVIPAPVVSVIPAFLWRALGLVTAPDPFPVARPFAPIASVDQPSPWARAALGPQSPAEWRPATGATIAPLIPVAPAAFVAYTAPFRPTVDVPAMARAPVVTPIASAAALAWMPVPLRALGIVAPDWLTPQEEAGIAPIAGSVVVVLSWVASARPPMPIPADWLMPQEEAAIAPVAGAIVAPPPFVAFTRPAQPIAPDWAMPQEEAGVAPLTVQPAPPQWIAFTRAPMPIAPDWAMPPEEAAIAPVAPSASVPFVAQRAVAAVDWTMPPEEAGIAPVALAASQPTPTVVPRPMLTWAIDPPPTRARQGAATVPPPIVSAPPPYALNLTYAIIPAWVPQPHGTAMVRVIVSVLPIYFAPSPVHVVELTKASAVRTLSVAAGVLVLSMAARAELQPPR